MSSAQAATAELNTTIVVLVIGIPTGAGMDFGSLIASRSTLIGPTLSARAR